MATIASFIAVPDLAPNAVSSHSCTPPADWVAFAMVCRTGSDRPTSAPLAVGMPEPVPAKPFCTSGLTMYLRNSTHSAGAFLVHAKPSPPPIWVVWLPPAPGTDGNGNQLRKLGSFWSGVSDDMTPPSQWPMSSIAALPLATWPAELFAPAWPGVARKSFWNGWVPRRVFRSSPALTKHGSSNFESLDAAASASAEHSRTAKLYHQCAAGHLSPAPTAIGVTLAALSLVTAAFSSSSVLGGAVMPACANWSLLYQNPSMPKENGRPYCLPSTAQILATGPMLATSDLAASVMSIR